MSAAVEPNPDPRRIWVQGVCCSVRDFEPTLGVKRALESGFTGLTDCFRYNTDRRRCDKGQRCTHVHRRPWAMIELLSIDQRLKNTADVEFVESNSQNEVRAIFVGSVSDATTHPLVEITQALCTQGLREKDAKLLQTGGGPTAWLNYTVFDFPKTVQVTVRCGKTTLPFAAVAYMVQEGRDERDRGLLLLDSKPSQSADSKAFCLSLPQGSQSAMHTSPTCAVVSMECAPTLTVVEGQVHTRRCTALEHFGHPLSEHLKCRDLSESEAGAWRWTVSFKKKPRVAWVPAIVGATMRLSNRNVLPPSKADAKQSNGSPERVRSITVTPTAHYHNVSPGGRGAPSEAHDRCHFYRALGRDAFVTVKFREEDGSIVSRAPLEMVTRWEHVFNTPLVLHDTTYTFFALGSRSHQAYFIESTKARDAILALGVDPSEWERLPVHTRLKRLRLGLTTTIRVLPPVRGDAFSVHRQHDIKATDGTDLTDGSGVMSAAIKSHIQSFLDQQCAAIAQNSDCSGVQFRMGAFKGTLVAARGALAGGKDFEIFKSCEKVACSIDASTPLNIVATSKWSAGARLDKYVMTVLVNGGLTLNALMELGLETYADRAAALNVARRPELSRREKIDLWQQEVVEDTKKHVQINGVMGATLMGFIDPSGELQATAADPTDGSTTLPCVFVAPPSQPAHEAAYAELSKTGKAVITRSPTYALGDVRVVRVLTAADMPSLDHLRDVLVFPRKGPTSLPALMSGGDLDGDEFKLVWDPRVLGSFRTIDESTPPAPLQGAANNADRASAPTMTDAEYAGQCLNERSLLGRLHRAQLGWLLADPHGAKAKRCAALCGQEVDGRAAGKFIVSHSVKDLTQPPPFIATIGRPTPMARQVQNHVDVYVSAPRLSIKHWWPAIAAIEQDGITPYPEDEFLAAVGFPAQQGLGRLARLQWYSAAGLHQSRVEHMPVTTIVDAAPGTSVNVLTTVPVRRAIGAAKRRSKDFNPVGFDATNGQDRRSEMEGLVAAAAMKLSAPEMLASLFPSATSTDAINVTVRASVGSSLFPCGGKIKPREVGDLVDAPASPNVPARVDAAAATGHSVQPTPHAPRGNASGRVQRGFEKYSPPKPLFLGRDGTWIKARNVTAAIAECGRILDRMADHLARRFGVGRGDIEKSVKLRTVIRPHLPSVMSTLRQWSIDVEPGKLAPIAVRDLDSQQIKFGPAFLIRGRGPETPADTMRFGIRAAGSGLLSGDTDLRKPIAHLELDDTPNAFPVKVVGADHPAVEIVIARLVGQTLLHVREPTTGNTVSLHVKLRTVFDPAFGNEMWSKPTWEVEPSVIIDARNPELVKAALASMDTLLDAQHYEGMLRSS